MQGARQALAALAQADDVGEVAHVVHFAMPDLSESGKPSELMHAARLPARHIAAAMEQLAGAPRRERDTVPA